MEIPRLAPPPAYKRRTSPPKPPETPPTYQSKHTYVDRSPPPAAKRALTLSSADVEVSTISLALTVEKPEYSSQSPILKEHPQLKETQKEALQSFMDSLSCKLINSRRIKLCDLFYQKKALEKALAVKISTRAFSECCAPYLLTLEFSNGFNFESVDDFRQLFESLTNLTRLSIHIPQENGLTVGLLAQCVSPRLQELELSYIADVSPQELATLFLRCSELKMLNLFGASISDEHLAAIVDATPQLQEIRLNSSALTDQAFASLKKAHQLKSCTFYYLKDLGLNFIDFLSSQPLESLSCKSLPLTNAHFREIGRLPLKQLQLADIPVSDGQFRLLLLNETSPLSTFKIEESVSHQKSSLKRKIECLVSSKKVVEEFTISNAIIDDSDFKRLMSSGVQKLHLHHCELQQIDFSSISQLQELSLDGSTLSDLDVAAIFQHGSRLQKLSLKDAPNITDGAFEGLKKNDHLNLQSFYISKANITDKCVLALANASPNLTVFHHIYPSVLSTASLIALVELCPFLRYLGATIDDASTFNQKIMKGNRQMEIGDLFMELAQDLQYLNLQYTEEGLSKKWTSAISVNCSKLEVFVCTKDWSTTY